MSSPGRRRRLARRRLRERLERERARAQSSIEPCGYCGRAAGQLASPDSARVVFHGPEAGPELEGTPVLIEDGPHKGLPAITRPSSGGHGCRFCVDGLPGETWDGATPPVIRITYAPTREQLERGEPGPPPGPLPGDPNYTGRRNPA